MNTTPIRDFKGLLRQTEIGVQCIVDEGLIPLSSSLGLSLEALQDRIVEIVGDVSVSEPR